MRKLLAAAALGAALSATLLPAQSASAVCFTVHGLPGCYNPCTIVASRVPVGMNCLA